MRKELIVLFVILASILFNENIQAQEAYAVLKRGVLTFKYDNNKPDGAYEVGQTGRSWYDVTYGINL